VHLHSKYNGREIEQHPLRVLVHFENDVFDILIHVFTFSSPAQMQRKAINLFIGMELNEVGDHIPENENHSFVKFGFLIIHRLKQDESRANIVLIVHVF